MWFTMAFWIEIFAICAFFLPYILTNKCENRWISYGDSCYYYRNVTSNSAGVTYRSAQLLCQSVGAELVSITSLNESIFISSIFSDPSVKDKQQYWIGLNDLSIEGLFLWTDGSNSTFRNWFNGKLNNDKENDCVQISFDGSWSVVKCFLTLGFICKRASDYAPNVVPNIPASDERIPPSSLTCEIGWKQWGTSCYGIIYKTFRKWQDARNDCVRRFADLVIFETTEELKFITNNLDRKQVDFWIGLTDKHNEGNFHWVNEKPLNSSLSNWQSGAPDNGQGNENCVAMHSKSLGGKWNDFHCKSVKNYICEKQAGKHNCPYGWIAHDNYCYQLNIHPNRKLTWKAARESCLAFNEPWRKEYNVARADLVSIHSREESIFLKNELSNIDGLNDNEYFWIGLMKHGDLMRWSDHTVLKHQDLLAPFGSILKNDVDTCAKIGVGWGKKWLLASCNETHNYVCKVKRGHGRCYDPLGMQNFEIPDAAITSNAQLSSSTPPSAGRLHMVPQKENSGAWCAELEDAPWLQVNFGIPRKLTYIAVQGNSSSKSRVTMFRIYYSQNGKFWDAYDPGVAFHYRKRNESDFNEVAYFKFTHEFITQYIQIRPIKCDFACCMRMEFYGCHHDIEEEKCGYGWKINDKSGYCYKFSTHSANWDVAASHCKSAGADLVSITSKEEQSYINEQLKVMSGTIQDFWIGLNDLDAIGKFRWIDESPILFNNSFETKLVKSTDKPYNLPKPCGIECGQFGGRCSYCGHGGYCCMEGKHDCPTNLRQLGGNSSYMCVIDPKEDTGSIHTCGYIHSADGQWRNTYCEKRKPYICKRSYKVETKKNVEFIDNWQREALFYWPLYKVINGSSMGTIVARAVGNFSNVSNFPIPNSENNERKVLHFGGNNYLKIFNINYPCFIDPGSSACVHGLTFSFLLYYSSNKKPYRGDICVLNNEVKIRKSYVGFSISVGPFLNKIHVLFHSEGRYYSLIGYGLIQDSWNHVVVSWNRFHWNIYVNGTESKIDVNNIGRSVKVSKDEVVTTFYVGKCPEGYGPLKPQDFKLTSLAIFDRILTKSNIKDIFRFEFGKCDNHLVGYGLHCYGINKYKKYPTTSDACQLDGGHEMSVHSVMEQAFMMNFIKQHRYASSPWIGFRLESNTWVDGTEVSYSNWNEYVQSGNRVSVDKNGYWKMENKRRMNYNMCKFRKALPRIEATVQFNSSVIIPLDGKVLTRMKTLKKEFSISFQSRHIKRSTRLLSLGTSLKIDYKAMKLWVCLFHNCLKSHQLDLNLQQWTTIKISRTKDNFSYNIYNLLLFINGTNQASRIISAKEMQDVPVVFGTLVKRRNGEVRNLKIEADLPTTNSMADNVIRHVVVLGRSHWGKWGKYIQCVYGTRIIGFRLQVQPSTHEDNTALNGIQLACSDGSVSEEIIGSFGTWRNWVSCLKSPSAFVTHFKLRSSFGKSISDNTGASNVKMKCNDGTVLDGHGTNNGYWDPFYYKTCIEGTHFCGVQAQSEEEDPYDKTGVNKLKFLCCANNVTKDPCPPGYSMYNEHSCFQLNLEEVSLDEAIQTCQIDGASLASIESSDEELFIVSMMAQLYKDTDVWIGLKYNLSSQIYSWIDGRPVFYTNWYNGEPDPRTGSYVKAGVHQGVNRFLFWKSAGKMEKLPFLCRKSLGKVNGVRDNNDDKHSETIDLAGSIWNWYHDGVNKNGEVEFTSIKKVKWNGGDPQGSWSVDKDIVKTTFNSTFHILKVDITSGVAVLSVPLRQPRTKMVKRVDLPSQYYALIYPITWSQAVDACKKWGGQLVTIRSAAQNSFIMNLLKKKNIDRAWIGCNDRNNEGRFRWLYDDKYNRYSNWRRFASNGKHSENCAVIDKRWNYKWDHRNCNTKASSVCHKDQVSLINEQKINSNDVNIAMNKPSQQSSTYGHLNANKAKWGNDGDVTTGTATGYSRGINWWEVDLEKIIKIQKIVLHLSLFQLFKDRYQKVIVETRSRKLEVWSVCKNVGHVTSTPVIVQCDQPTDARYIRVILENYAYLSLYEVLVYGNASTIKVQEIDTGDARTCPYGWIQRKENCYFHNNNELSQRLASSACVKLGGQIASISNLEENKFIFELLQKSSLFGIHVWIGLTNQAIYRGYYWHDESPVTFLNWNTNAPYKGLRHFCVGMGNNGRWMDLPCESLHQSVCKIDRHKLRCKGGEDTVCCTPETPCSVGEGDCDNNADCAADLICGSDNCPWGDADCCTEAYSCLEKDTGYHGNDLLFQSNISSWQTCSELCRAVPRCNAWTWNAPGFFNKTMWGNCSLKTSDTGRMKRVGLISGLRECGIKKLRCHGDDTGCCTPDTPCGIGEGDCDENEDCAGNLKCGSNNCPWGDGDDCCFRDLRCIGGDISCCSPGAPCLIGEGDCDNNADCAGDLICGSDNCPWGDDDCCTEAYTCMEKDIDYYGYNIQTQWNITSWLSCSELCRAVPRCKAWTWNAPKSFNETLWNTCNLKTSDSGRLNVTGRISGSRECGRKKLRCHGDDSGCCTPDTPCGEGEGDCDENEDCAGNLICGSDNCPWGDGDDCCFRSNMQCTFKLGDGTGGSEVKIGTQKGVECAQACYARSRTDYSINGATVYSETSKGGCWCERYMKYRDTRKIYKSCFFTEEWCSFKTGDGIGTSEVKIGQQNGMDCVEACRKRSFTDGTINGATVYSDSGKGGCWCERKMRGRNSGRKYKSCFFSTSGPTSFQICENATSDEKVLSCPDNRVLNIMEALYGRKSLIVCAHTQHQNIQDCGNATSSLIQAKKMCDGKMSCTLKAANSMFGDPCLHVNKYLDVTYECIRNWTLQQTNVCFEAKNNGFGNFTIKETGIVDAIKLVHQSGYVSCRPGSGDNSNWGCNRDLLVIVITDESNKVLFPSSVSVNSKGKYHLRTYTSQSKEIVITNHFEKIKVNKDQVLRLWYGEDLKGFTEFDNHGRSCADVFAYVKSAKHDCQIKVLSNDYQVGGRNGSDVGKYFHFYRNSIRGLQKGIVLTFVARNSRTGDIGRVKVWGSSKGGSVGNAHGRFDGDPIFAKAGQWAVGDFIIPRDASSCADECPASHPYVYFGGVYCCMSSKEKINTPQGAACDGGAISLDSKCCANNSYTRCPHGGNCVNHRKTNAFIPDINFALNKPSTQSTTYGNLRRNGADKANDGNMLTRSATWGKPGDEWWEVDLEKLIKIQRIVLYLYPYALRTKKYQKLMVLTRSSIAENWVLCKNIGMTSSPSVKLTCNMETNARYVKITLQNDDTFYLTEVEVYGTQEEIKTNQTGKEWCTFEKNLCGYNISGTWERKRGSTPSHYTGPKSGVDGSKWYVYAEASGEPQGYVSTLVSPIFPGRNGSQCYSWFYHMFGKGVGKLIVYLNVSNTTTKISERHGNHGDSWYKEHYEMTSNDSFQIRFVVIRGSSYQGDIALDNLFLLLKSCDVNVALNKPSNLSDKYDAQLVNDGSIDTKSDRIALGQNVSSWWEVDLQTSIRISKIHLYVRIEIYERETYDKVKYNRERKLTVFTRVTNSEKWTICKTISPLNEFLEVKCEQPTVARYVRVKLWRISNRTDHKILLITHLSFAEVEVYAVHNTSCSLSEYTCEANKRQPGVWKTIHNVTIDKCAKLCCLNAECIGFTHTPRTHLCSLSKNSRNQRPLLKLNDGTSQCQIAEETARTKLSGKPFVMFYTDCWFKCGLKGGRCSFCGDKGYCCRKNYKDCPLQLSSVAGDYHVCVHDPSADETIKQNISGICDEGWAYFKDHCYHFSLGKASYYEALQKCRNNGSHLTSILGADENAFLVRSFKAGYSKYAKVYIGMNDLTNEGVWHWEDGSVLKYVNFIPGEPNDHSGGEDCMEMRSSSGQWNDIPCNLKRTYICKKHLNDTDVKPIPTETPANGWCEPGWHLYGSKCYLFSFDERKSFKGALAYCRRFSGGNLVSVHSSLEHAFLLSHMHSTFGSVYIGLYEWDHGLYWSDQSDLDYTNWGDNGYMDSKFSGRSAVMRPDNDGRWTVSDYSYHFNFICQRAVSTTSQNSTLPGTTSSSSICPESYTLYNGDCYKAMSTPKSWYDAKQECEKVPGKKGNLVSYHDIFTQAFVFSRLTKYHRSWIGLNRQKNDVNVVWSDNTPLDFNFWKNGQIPVNNDSGLCIAEGHSSTFRGSWEGINCNLQLPFTCKISLREVSVTPNYVGNCTAGWQKFGRTCYKFFYSSTRTRRSLIPWGPWPHYVRRHYYRTPNYRRTPSRSTTQNKMKCTWSQARKECQRYGGELATVDSKEIDQFIEKLVESSKQSTTFKIWIGLNDRDKEHIWRWSSGAPYYVNGFTNWGDGEPKDSFTYSGADCVAIDTSTYKWSDEDCTKEKHWICEHPLECRVVLGMENKNIPDNSITASSYADNYYPKYARLNAKIGSMHTAWCANASDLEPSLTINLGEEMIVTLIQLQGLTNNYVTLYKLNYSMDGKTWLTYSEDNGYGVQSRVLPGNDYSDGNKKIVGAQIELKAIFLKFIPMQYTKLPCMRLELFGCKSVCGRALGMASHLIPNDRLSASSSDIDHPVEHARPKFAASGWCSAANDMLPWYQIDLGQPMKVSRIMLSGSGFRDYIVLFDGKESRWDPYTGYDGNVRIFPINPTLHDLEYPQLSRHVLIRPNTAFEIEIASYCLQVELYGCEYECDESLVSDSYLVTDVQFTASSQDPNHPISFARLNQGTFNKNSWCAAVKDLDQYLQIDFANHVRITHVAVQGFDGDVPQFVKTYNLFWSRNGNFFHHLEEELIGNSNGIDVNKMKLSEPVLARSIRLNPTTFSGGICMRVELYGCSLDPIDAKQESSPSAGLSRGGKIAIISFFCICLLILLLVGTLYYRKRRGDLLFRAFLPAVIELKDDVNLVDDNDDNDYEEDYEEDGDCQYEEDGNLIK